MGPEHTRASRALTLVPAAGWLTLFFLIPLMIVALISVMQRGSPVDFRFDGSAYMRLLDPIYIKVLWRSLELALTTTFISLLLGYPLAFFIATRTARVRRWLYYTVLIPLWANSLLLLYAWMVLLRPNGIIDNLLHVLGLAGDSPVSLLYTPVAVIIGLVYWYLPFMIYPVYAAIEKIDFRLMDAAADLGAGPVHTFWRVLWPLSRPGVAAGCLLVFVESFGAFLIPDLLGGAKTLMLGNVIQLRFLSMPQDWPLAAAVSLVLVAAVVLAVAIGRRRAHIL